MPRCRHCARSTSAYGRSESLCPGVGHGPEGRHVEWKLPVYNTIYHILTNPAYAGAYVFGRSGSRVTIEAGRKKIVRGFRRERNDWEVLIKDHHEGYITWAEFEKNQGLITDNANGKSFMSRGSVRSGEGLLAGSSLRPLRQQTSRYLQRYAQYCRAVSLPR
nr:recombinase family protein [Bradyrhizobium yuanmingense]